MPWEQSLHGSALSASRAIDGMVCVRTSGEKSVIGIKDSSSIRFRTSVPAAPHRSAKTRYRQIKRNVRARGPTLSVACLQVCE